MAKTELLEEGGLYVSITSTEVENKSFPLDYFDEDGRRDYKEASGRISRLENNAKAYHNPKTYPSDEPAGYISPLRAKIRGGSYSISQKGSSLIEKITLNHTVSEGIREIEFTVKGNYLEIVSTEYSQEGNRTKVKEIKKYISSKYTPKEILHNATKELLRTLGNREMQTRENENIIGYQAFLNALEAEKERKKKEDEDFMVRIKKMSQLIGAA